MVVKDSMRDISEWICRCEVTNKFILLFRLFTVFKFKWLAMVQKRSNRFRTLLKKVKKHAFTEHIMNNGYGLWFTRSYWHSITVEQCLWVLYFLILLYIIHFFCIKLTSWPKWIRAATAYSLSNLFHRSWSNKKMTQYLNNNN